MTLTIDPDNLADSAQDLLAQLHTDNALINVHTGLNINGRDKLASTSIGAPPSFSAEQLLSLYRGSNLFANLVDTLPNAITQEWVDYKCPDPAMEQWMQQQINLLGEHFNLALKQARLYGGACIVIYINDLYAPGLGKPINRNRIESIVGYRVLSSNDIAPHTWNADFNSADYGKVIYWKLTDDYRSNQLIHTDRVIPFYGVKLPDRRVHESGWNSDSVIVKAHKKLVNLDQSDDAIASSLQSFNQTVLFIHDLARKVMDETKKEMVKVHLRTVAFLQSVLGILALDAENERYEIFSRDYTGVPDILEHCKQMAAGATDIPLTQLLNRSPSGITSGSSEQKDWAKYVAARQKTDVLPALTRLVDLLHLVRTNPAGGVAPRDYELIFPSVVKLTELEEKELQEKSAAIMKTKIDTLKVLIEARIDPQSALKLLELEELKVMPEFPSEPVLPPDLPALATSS